LSYRWDHHWDEESDEAVKHFMKTTFHEVATRKQHLFPDAETYCIVCAIAAPITMKKTMKRTCTQICFCFKQYRSKGVHLNAVNARKAFTKRIHFISKAGPNPPLANSSL
jgi:hypothetical protein